MKACIKLATMQRDDVLGAECEAAFTRGSAALSEQMWSEDSGYFRAVVPDSLEDPKLSWLMGDTLFGLVVAEDLGLGELFANSSARVRQHLASELRYLGTEFGLQTFADTTNATNCPLMMNPTNCKDKSLGGLGMTMCDTAWGQLDGTWTSALIRLNRSEGAAQALLAPGSPLYQQMEHGYNTVRGPPLVSSPSKSNRSVENAFATLIAVECAQAIADVWNPHAYTATVGDLASLPLSNSHYGMHMVMWWVVPSLSGAQYDGINRTLTLEPSALPDENGVTRLPVFLAGQSACIVSMTRQGGFGLRLVWGSSLNLASLCATVPGGVGVQRCATAPVVLRKVGDSVAWGGV